MTIDLNKILKEKLLQALDLGDYAEQLRGQVLQVWVNPPANARKPYDEIFHSIREIDKEIKALTEVDGKYPPEDLEKARAALKEAYEAEMTRMEAWLAEMWSQGKDTVSAEQVHELRTGSADQDPRLFGWLMGRTAGMIREHLDFVKKV